MICVIIAGGSGTRLWPLSTPEFPKHLLTIGEDENSLLQNTYNRAKLISDKIYIVTDASHVQHVKNQLPELSEDSFIVEPARRGTASCIVAALEYISRNHDNDESIACVAADHYIRDTSGFIHSFSTADDISKTEKKLVLIGVEPDYPATGFGYVQKGTVLNEDQFIFNVESFNEKPNLKTAQAYLRTGKYLWNCGYFVGSINTFSDAMRQYSPDLYDAFVKLKNATPDTYEEEYLSLENNSIDYALIEKVGDLLVVPAAFDWMDLGSYSDLSKAVNADEAGNYANGQNVHVEEVQNMYIENQEDKPVVVIGLDNCVVINTAHGILVTRKDLSQKVGDVSKRISQ